MKLTLDDLKRTEFYQYLPTEQLKNYSDGMFLVFFYWYDDKTSKITDISAVEVVSKITLGLNKKRPNKGGIFPYEIGFFQTPFDTQNLLFYQFLKYYFVDKADENQKKENEKKLFQFFANARVSDLENIEQKQKNTLYSNSFNIFSRDNFIASVERFVQSRQQVKDDVVRIADCIDTHIKKEKQKSFYGDYLKKVVMGVLLPSGDLMPENVGTMRYLYCGENSYLAKQDNTLEEAKSMYRESFSADQVYIKTGWFFNSKDGKWRKRIVGDKQAEMVYPSLNEAYIPNKSVFYGRRKEVFDLMTVKNLNTSLTTLEGFLRDGYDVTLGQILDHKELYKNYPQLYKMPIFIAKTDKLLVGGDRGDKNKYAFFYNPSLKYLFICGNEIYFDLKTVLLHEIQHAIQHIEGFAEGGDTRLAQMIQALGGEGVREFFFTSRKLNEIYEKEANESGRFSFSNYTSLMNKLKAYAGYFEIKGLPVIAISKEQEYYNSLSKVVMDMINYYLVSIEDNKIKNNLTSYLGTSFCEKAEVLIKFHKQGQTAFLRLRGEGFNEREINDIFFKTYELLLGEIESRDVQRNSQIEEDILGYASPLTSESIEKEKVTVIFKSLKEEGELPKFIRSGLETQNGEYVLHLFESVSATPILHELGHIVCDIIGKEAIETEIANKIEKEKIEQAGGLQETFVQLFMNYLAKQPLSPKTVAEITEANQLQEIEIFNDRFDAIFYPKTDENEQEFIKMINYVKKLDEVTEGYQIAVTEQVVTETPKEEVAIVEEKPTEIVPSEQLVVVEKKITNLNQLKNHLKLGTILRVSYNKNKPDWVGTYKTVSYVQTNGIYLASGTEVPQEAVGTQKPFSVKGLSWLEYPKVSNFKFNPNGFDILYKDKDGNLIPFLGYEYVEKVIGSATPSVTLTTNEGTAEQTTVSDKYSEHIERVLAMDEKQIRAEVEELKKQLSVAEENLKVKLKEKDEERKRLKESGFNNFEINTRIGSWVREIEQIEKEKKKLKDTIVEKSEVADRVAIVKDKKKSDEKIKELVDYINANREKEDKPNTYYAKENDLRKYLGVFVYLYTDKKPRPNIYDLIDFYSIFGLEFLMKNDFDNIKKLADMYLLDFRAEAERLKEEWRAENPLPKIYDKETQELHRGKSEKYAKQKIKENARELKMIGA